VRILIAAQGQWGWRIVDHLKRTAPSDWQIRVWQGPTALPLVIDEPDEFLPRTLPQADLLIVLTESAGLTDLAPDLAQMCSAQAVIIPVDKRAWAPPGLLRQVRGRLSAMNIGSAAPMPFCSLAPTKSQHPLIQEFAGRYGRPKLVCDMVDHRVARCEIARETPCGNTRYIVERLPGISIDSAAEQAGLLHHYYPCWGGMGVDPVQGSHTLLHIAATIAQKSVQQALRDAKNRKEEGS
jgi:hypothetical protein